MAKKSDGKILTIFKVFWDGIVVYCRNLDAFLKYMIFPVFGQIIGASVIFAVNYYFIVNIPVLIKKYPLLDNIPLVFTLLTICVFPGFLIFCKAFYDFIIAFGSLNSMVNVSRGEKHKPLDTKVHDDILKKRLPAYIVLWILLTAAIFVGIFPLFIIPFTFACVYISLIFQVFSSEDGVTVTGAFSRSIHLVKGNYLPTLILLILSFVLTYLLIPSLIVWAFEKADIIPYFAYPVQKYIDILPINNILNSAVAQIAELSAVSGSITFDVKSMVNVTGISQSIVRSIITTSVIMFLLPLRSAWFMLLYKIYDNEKTDELRKTDPKKG